MSGPNSALGFAFADEGTATDKVFQAEKIERLSQYNLNQWGDQLASFW